MSFERMTELRVGIFVFLGMVLGLIMIFFVGSGKGTLGRTYLLSARFESISGLQTGASVQLAGMRVGTVEAMSFPDSLNEQGVSVQLQINRKYQDRIRKDSIATIETQGLLGDKVVSITVGSSSSPKLEAKEWLQVGETATLFEVAEEASGAIGELHETLKSLRHTVEAIEKGDGFLHSLVFDPKGREAFDAFVETAKSSQRVMQSIEGAEGTLGRLIRDPALYEDIRTLFGRASRSTLLKAVIRATLREREKHVLKE